MAKKDNILGFSKKKKKNQNKPDPGKLNTRLAYVPEVLKPFLLSLASELGAGAVLPLCSYSISQ